MCGEEGGQAVLGPDGERGEAGVGPRACPSSLPPRNRSPRSPRHLHGSPEPWPWPGCWRGCSGFCWLGSPPPPHAPGSAPKAWPQACPPLQETLSPGNTDLAELHFRTASMAGQGCLQGGRHPEMAGSWVQMADSTGAGPRDPGRASSHPFPHMPGYPPPLTVPGVHVEHILPLPRCPNSLYTHRFHPHQALA